MKRAAKIISTVLLMTGFFTALVASDEIGAKAAKKNPDPGIEQMLLYAIQDEYLARAEYYEVIDRFGSVRPFSNIVKSEQTHVGLLVPLFEKYGFTVPEDTYASHVVVPDDLKSALEIGVQAEIDNIAMYESFLERDLPEDVRAVFERLKAASENHLGAFRNGLSRYQ
ncbi:MAG: DUF2202 domain-containing protein [Spirochaetes bacterium]|nr:DUF2202 domain-containing protein [Spirochaetota bacterium]